jgi:nucleoside-diphosphate-sugar epimerase
MRPNLHIADMVALYRHLLEVIPRQIDGRIYNAGYENLSVRRIAELVRETLAMDITIEVTPTDDNRSYHVSSELMKKELGFVPRHTVADAISDLKDAFNAGKVPDPLDAVIYYNIRRMQEINLQ